MNDPLADLLLRIDGEAGGNRRLTQGWADDIAARLRAAGVTLAAPPSDPAAPLDDTAADWYRQGWEAGNKAPSDPAAHQHSPECGGLPGDPFDRDEDAAPLREAAQAVDDGTPDPVKEADRGE